MVVFMIMASQFKSLRLPFIMLFTIPVSLIGIVLALLAAGQGFSITALMGVLMVVGIAVSNGILLIDDANRRFNEGADKVEAVIAAARTRFVPIAMTSLATVIGLIPTAIGPRGGHRVEPAARARRRRRPDVVDAAVAVPGAGDVPAHRAPRFLSMMPMTSSTNATQANQEEVVAGLEGRFPGAAHAPVDGQHEERRREHQQQAVAALPPEPQEEEANRAAGDRQRAKDELVHVSAPDPR